MNTPATMPASATGFAGPPSAERMMHVITQLAADEYTGRRTGTPGGHAAAAWLATHLETLGAQVTVDEFTVTGAVRELRGIASLHWTDGTAAWDLEHRREFAEHLASANLSQPVTGQLRIFGGGHNGVWLLDSGYDAQRANMAARDGAVGIVVPRTVDEGGWMPKMIAGPATAPLPVVSVREDIHARMTAASDGGTAMLTASIPLHPADVTGINVYGVFAAAPHAGLSVLLTAHFDGVGDDPGLRFTAACDNASGVAAVIETATILSTSMPDIGVAVALLDAEEAGLHGAARHSPQVPPGTVVINLDGAAAMHQPASVEAGGPAHSLLLALDTAARTTGIALRASAYRSDHRRYAQAGLATVGIGMGMPGYQTPAETTDRVDPHTLTAAAGLLMATVRNLAAAAPASPLPDIAEISREQLAELIRHSQITTVEALPEHVYAQGHLPGALNIRPRRVTELAPILLPDKDTPIAVYCGDAGCDASLRVARRLWQLGYTNVSRYTGGKHDWTSAGLPLHTPGS